MGPNVLVSLDWPEIFFSKFCVMKYNFETWSPQQEWLYTGTILVFVFNFLDLKYFWSRDKKVLWPENGTRTTAMSKQITSIKILPDDDGQVPDRPFHGFKASETGVWWAFEKFRNVVRRVSKKLWTGCPTNPFTILELHNLSHDVPEQNKIRRSPDLEALKLWKGSSGGRESR